MDEKPLTPCESGEVSGESLIIRGSEAEHVTVYGQSGGVGCEWWEDWRRSDC